MFAVARRQRCGRRSLRWVGACVLVLAGCAQTALSQADQRVLAQQYVGQAFEVRHTSVIGALYDDNERELLSAYPFDEVFAAVDLTGAPMHPASPRALVPAGTEVTLVGMEFPGPWTWTRRMLATPHDVVWLQLALKPEHPGVSGMRRGPLILPLHTQARSMAALEKAITRYLAPAGEVSGWLRGRKPPISVAIRHKEALVGMDAAELEASLGPPWRTFNDRLHDGQEVRVAWYPKHEIWLREGTVVALRPSRLVTR